MVRYYVKIDGIYCNHCREMIEKALKALSGVSSAKVHGNIAYVIAGEDVSETMKIAILNLGYVTKSEWIHTGYNLWKILDFLKLLAGLCCIVLFWRLLRRVLGYDKKTDQ